MSKRKRGESAIINKEITRIYSEGKKANTISIELHETLEKYIKENCTGYEYRNASKRKDKRTWQEFIEDIKKGTLKEENSMYKFTKDMKGRGHIVRFRDNGIDNTGNIIIAGVVTGVADYKISIDGKSWQKWDIKNNPKTNEKMTFKVKDLHRYVKQNSYMLVCMPDFWTVIGPKFIEGLIEDWPQGNDPRFAAGKPSIKIQKIQWELMSSNKMFKYYVWGDKKKYTGPSNKKITYAEFNEQNKAIPSQEYKDIFTIDGETLII